jgi:hypothetical protein
MVDQYDQLYSDTTWSLTSVDHGWAFFLFIWCGICLCMFVGGCLFALLHRRFYMRYLTLD